MIKNNKKPLVCILTYNGLCMFEFGIALEVFALPRPEIKNWYDTKIVASNHEIIRTIGGMTITAPHNLKVLEEASLIIIPGWKTTNSGVDKSLKKALLKAHENGTKIATICSGVFLLAECGLTDNISVTTHWKYTQTLKDNYPLLSVEPDILYIDEGKILTSAGSAAGLDLCLHIVRQDYGSEIANKVARQLVLPAHREGGQAQYIPRPLPKERGGKIAPLLDKIRTKLDEKWPIKRMANTSSISSRTLLRRFKNATGESPLVWVTMERLSRVRELLETTNLSLNEIAEASGFASPEILRHHFKRQFNTNPLSYRSSFNV